LGNGDGTLQGQKMYGVEGSPTSLAAGDFNGDGKLDLVTANRYGNSISVLLGNGDGTFQPAVSYAAGDVPESVAVGDLNGDGKLDVVVADNISGRISVLIGIGDGTFQPAVGYWVNPAPVSIAIADLNGDGIPDLAVLAAGETVAILVGQGDGTFQYQPTNFIAGSDPGFTESLVVGDFNGDGRPDVAVALGYVAQLGVLLNHTRIK
jgi:hypothetical protein